MKNISTFWIALRAGLVHQSTHTHCCHLILQGAEGTPMRGCREAGGYIEALMTEHWA
jgi:hypothetical protein